MFEGNRGSIGKWGLYGTLAYILVLLNIVWYNWNNFSSLEPNEWGDFLAGTFGPIALGWVVLGFFLQSKELQNSVDALKLQAEELKNSVDQQKAMVGITEKQLQLDIEVREEQTKQSIATELPLIKILEKGGGGSNAGMASYRFALQNLGPDAIDVKLWEDEKQYFKSEIRTGLLKRGGTRDFTIRASVNTPDWVAILSVESTNLRNHSRTQTFKVGNFVPVEISCDPKNQ